MTDYEKWQMPMADLPPRPMSTHDTEAQVTLRLTAFQAVVLRDLLHDDLVEDYCCECGQEKAPDSGDDLRESDHGPECALWGLHETFCKQMP